MDRRRSPSTRTLAGEEDRSTAAPEQQDPCMVINLVTVSYSETGRYSDDGSRGFSKAGAGYGINQGTFSTPWCHPFTDNRDWHCGLPPSTFGVLHREEDRGTTGLYD